MGSELSTECRTKVTSKDAPKETDLSPPTKGLKAEDSARYPLESTRYSHRAVLFLCLIIVRQKQACVDHNCWLFK